MPLTLVATQRPGVSGLEPTFAAANASGSGGNYCLYGDHTCIEVIADGTAAASTTITIQTPQTADGNALADRTIALLKSHSVRIPLRPVYKQGNGTVVFDCSATITGITVAVVQY